jgi:hypothetical protein
MMDTLNTVVNLSLLPALRLFHPLLAANGAILLLALKYLIFNLYHPTAGLTT